MKKFDREYGTTFLEESAYLKEHGVKYTFVKVDSEGRTTWKYAKTPELFECLKNFYSKFER